jgi:hypothetical protein
MLPSESSLFPDLAGMVDAVELVRAGPGELAGLERVLRALRPAALLIHSCLRLAVAGVGQLPSLRSSAAKSRMASSESSM